MTLVLPILPIPPIPPILQILAMLLDSPMLLNFQTLLSSPIKVSLPVKR